MHCNDALQPFHELPLDCGSMILCSLVEGINMSEEPAPHLQDAMSRKYEEKLAWKL
jgi:hypothetical protein